MPCDPFLMKKWIKSEVCGTREQCMGALFTGEKSNVAAKKKRERTNTDTAFSPIQMST